MKKYATIGTPTAPLPRRRSGLSVASLVLALLWLGGTGSILAVIFGHIAGREAKQAGAIDNMAQWGFVLGILGIVLTIQLAIAAS